MKKNYLKPTVKARKIEMESLMAAISGVDSEGNVTTPKDPSQDPTGNPETGSSAKSGIWE